MKTALITGANKGIGHEVARQLAAKGFHVLVGARDPKAGRRGGGGDRKEMPCPLCYSVAGGRQGDVFGNRRCR